jgi:hypothetical protein
MARMVNNESRLCEISGFNVSEYEDVFHPVVSQERPTLGKYLPPLSSAM